ncbi:MAG: methyltransferase domain-containing protein [Potamolinea sp.]
MKKAEIREAFDRAAFDYDGFIPRLIPYYHEQHNLMLDLITFERNSSIKVLDLGSGTGVLSHHILREFSQAKVVAFDLSEIMLEVCQKNLSAYEHRVSFQEGNFAEDDLGNEYDLVISGLAIHHLDGTGKQELFKRVFQSMNPGGIFLVRDIVVGASPKLRQQYESLWRQYMRSNGEDDEKFFAGYLAQDQPSSVEDQTQWLREAGFEDVGCHWQYFNFAIFGGCKPGGK